MHTMPKFHDFVNIINIFKNEITKLLKFFINFFV